MLLKRTLAGAGLALASLSSLYTPSTARACGGFFCNNSQPVNQAAERIVFSTADDGSVTAIIEVQYQGEAEDFAWMLPVAGTPEVGVSSTAALDRLQAATNPSYRLTTVVEGECDTDDFDRFGFPNASAGAPDAGASAPDDDEPEVSVLDAGSVGPYDYITIAVEPGPDSAAAALEWLREQGFDVDDFGGDLLREYLDAGMNLVAFRLTKGAGAGEIRPVRLSFGQGLPAIPIRPTAVAANEDMGVLVWVLGEARAVPANYRDLELNEAAINWLSPGSNYNSVVTRAANEAGGHGFVTELAGEAAPLAERIYSASENERWLAFRDEDWAGREDEFLQRLLFSERWLSTLDGMQEAFLLLKPSEEIYPGLRDEDWQSCPSCYFRGGDEALVTLAQIEAFLSEVDTEIIPAMRDLRSLFTGGRYVTRLYTTMSPHEMTLDPVFDFNPNLEDYSNVHRATRFIECSSRYRRNQAPWRVELASGDVVRGAGNNWPLSASDDFPAAAVVRRVGSEGFGTIIADNRSTIDSAISERNDEIDAMVAIGDIDGDGEIEITGCSAGGSAPVGAFFLLTAMVFVRRRRH